MLGNLFLKFATSGAGTNAVAGFPSASAIAIAVSVFPVPVPCAKIKLLRNALINARFDVAEALF